ncbi:hypothetical protein FRB90_011268 [Tulasnella sp. 427]|nr:hypothetical protein FRB90_011268 [Tulasnella sp. 427]
MSNIATESTALSPRPKQHHHSTSIRRRGVGVSPQLPPEAHEQSGCDAKTFTPRVVEGWVGPHRDDDILSPDLRDAEEGRGPNTFKYASEEDIRRVGDGLSHLGDCPTRLSTQVQPTPVHPAALSRVSTSSSSTSRFSRPPSITLSSAAPIPPSRSHSGSRDSRPTSLSRTLSTQIPRLPTPDFSKVRIIPSQHHSDTIQAYTNPLNFLRRSKSPERLPSDPPDARGREMDDHLRAGKGYLEMLHLPEISWSWSWMWGPGSSAVAKTDSGGSSGSCSTTDSGCFSTTTSSKMRDSGLIATPEELGYSQSRRCSLPDAEQVRRSVASAYGGSERRLSSVFEEDSSDEEIIRDSDSRRRSRKEWRERTMSKLFPKSPERRYPTLKSPNLNDRRDEHPPPHSSPATSADISSRPLTLADILPSLQQTSARFTSKFPWAARSTTSGSGVNFVRLSGEEEAAVDAIGVSLSEDGGFGVDGIGQWNGFKWTLMLSVTSVFLMGLSALLVSLYTWFGAWSHAQVIIAVEQNLLIFATLAASTLILASLLGISGTLLNSRPTLAFYSLFLWPCLVSVLIVGYTAYKRRTFNLSGKLSQGWNQLMDDNDRAVVQNVSLALFAFAAAAALPSVFAHGFVDKITVNGKTYTGPDPGSSVGKSIIRLVDNTEPNHIDDGKNLACGKGAATRGAKLSGTANPGDTLSINWNAGDGSHWPHDSGPLITYLAKCDGDCSTFDATKGKWFKIDQVGKTKTPGNEWFQDTILHKGKQYSVKIPSGVASGNYLMRHEIIALHLADSLKGAEFYPSCSQWTIGGSSTGSPSVTAAFPGAYKATDPGIHINIWDKLGAYPFPGPAIAKFSGSSSASSNSTSSNNSSVSNSSSDDNSDDNSSSNDDSNDANDDSGSNNNNSEDDGCDDEGDDDSNDDSTCSDDNSSDDNSSDENSSDDNSSDDNSSDDNTDDGSCDYSKAAVKTVYVTKTVTVTASATPKARLARDTSSASRRSRAHTPRRHSS